MLLALCKLAFLGFLFPTPSPAPPIRMDCRFPEAARPALSSKERPVHTVRQVRDCLEDDDTDEVSSSRRRDGESCTLMLLPKYGPLPVPQRQFLPLERFRPGSGPLIYIFCTLLI